MEGELRTSAYFSIDPVSRKVNGQARDGVCFVSMLDWTRSDSFNALESRPNWDRYLVYYATTERPSGRLVRMAINPAKSTIPADIGSFPYPPFVDDPSRFMIEDPLTYSFDDLANSRVLASKVKSFSVKVIPTTQEVEVRTILRQNGIMSRRGDKHREGGTFELQYRVHPQNSQ